MPIIFYDLETFGLSPAYDRIAEFAGILTDDRLELQEHPYELRCVPPPDYIAHPRACLTTGITPQAALQTGLPEPDFARRIHRWFVSQGHTLILGYNNASFDDEFVRHLFYRTFLDPYGWHYRDGNRRMDLFSVIPAIFDFHRDALVWPRTSEGMPDFRLEALSEANEALGGTSHEALADTFALRNLTKLIQERLPAVWDSLPNLLDKRGVEGRLKAALSGAGDPFTGSVIYSSARIRRPERSSAVCLVLGREAGPGGQWWILDLASSPEELLTADPGEVASLWFTPERPAKYRILQRINPRRFPSILPVTSRQVERLDEIGLPWSVVEDNYRIAERQSVYEWGKRFIARMVEEGKSENGERDVDGQLYDGLPDKDDVKHMAALEAKTTGEIADYIHHNQFIDRRYQILVSRFLGRYASNRLTEDERHRFRLEALDRIDVEQFDAVWKEAVTQLRSGTLETALSGVRRRKVLQELRDHRNSVVRRMDLEERYGILTEAIE